MSPGASRFELWRVVPMQTPAVLRPCGRCGKVQPFRSSDRFRLNGQQRRVDVWLIYRCTVCESTWNFSLFVRALPAQIGPELYGRLMANDRETAWRHAFDRERLRRLGVQVEPAVPVEVQRLARVPEDEASGRHAIRLQVPYSCGVRLDRLLAPELGVSRSALERWHAQGILQILPRDRDPLRKPIRDGQDVTILEAARPAASREA